MPRFVAAILFGLVSSVCAFIFATFLFTVIYADPYLEYGPHDPRASSGLLWIFAIAMASLVLGTGVFAFRALNNQEKTNGWRALLVMGGMLVLGLSMSYFSHSRSSSLVEANSGDTAQSLAASGKEGIVVLSAIQDAEGMTQADWDLSFLRELDRYTVRRMETIATEQLAASGFPNSPLGITSDAVYVDTDTIRLAVIRMSLRQQEAFHSVVVYGIVGSELRRVSCVSRSAGTIPITFGVCGQKVADTFGLETS